MITIPSYKGPSSPAKFMGEITVLRFDLSNMDSEGKLAFNALSMVCPQGRVLVQRTNGIDYIYTWSGEQALFIALIPDQTRGFKIPLSYTDDGYEFGEMTALQDGPPFTRYMFEADTVGLLGGNARRQYIPYIFKNGSDSHVSVGDTGSPGGATLDPKFDWNYKYYILDCTGEQDALETLWRPPTQITRHAFGSELIPVWYSMSPNTSHGWHHCYERGIDQQKRLTYPINTAVTLAYEGISIPEFQLLSGPGKSYNWFYPINVLTFYGKNAFVQELDETTGEYVISKFSGKINLGGVVAIAKPEIDELLFFWPWIPYLDEIRCFNILWYSAKTELGQFQGYQVTPTLDSMRYWNLSYHTGTGWDGGETMRDSATFSDAPIGQSSNDSGWIDTECDCYDCGTGSRNISSTVTIGPYNSTGIRNVPIGLIGESVIQMTTTWQQAGSGQSDMVESIDTSGNFPYVTYFMGGTMWALEDFCLSQHCGTPHFTNTSMRTKTENETAFNNMSISQTLSIGSDVIFTGNSTMSYSMVRTLQDDGTGTIVGTADMSCPTEILYTTDLMTLGTSQVLHVDTEGLDCWEVSWAAGRGTLTGDIHSSSVTYTAPTTNPDCEGDTVTVECGSVTISLFISFNSYDDFAPAYWAVTTSFAGGHCCRGAYVGELPPGPSYVCRANEESAFGPSLRWSSFTCTGELFLTNVYSCGENAGCYTRGLLPEQPCFGPTSCGGIPQTPYIVGYYYDAPNSIPIYEYSDCGSLPPEEIFDVRTQKMKDNNCCPQPIAKTLAYWKVVDERIEKYWAEH